MKRNLNFYVVYRRLFWILLGYCLTPLPLLFMPFCAEKNPRLLQIAGVLGLFGSWGCLIFFFLQQNRRLNVDLFAKISFKQGKVIIGGGVIMILIHVTYLLISHNATTANDASLQTIAGWGNLARLTLCVYAVFFAPILEELFFRANVMGLCQPLPQLVRIIISAVIFAVAHDITTVYAAMAYGLLGAVLAFVYARTRNLSSSLMLHVLNNIQAMAVLF